MDIEEFYVDGNLNYIQSILFKDLRYNSDKLINSLVIVGIGDSLLITRIK